MRAVRTGLAAAMAAGAGFTGLAAGVAPELAHADAPTIQSPAAGDVLDTLGVIHFRVSFQPAANTSGSTVEVEFLVDDASTLDDSGRLATPFIRQGANAGATAALDDYKGAPAKGGWRVPGTYYIQASRRACQFDLRGTRTCGPYEISGVSSFALKDPPPPVLDAQTAPAYQLAGVAMDVPFTVGTHLDQPVAGAFDTGPDVLHVRRVAGGPPLATSVFGNPARELGIGTYSWEASRALASDYTTWPTTITSPTASFQISPPPLEPPRVRISSTYGYSRAVPGATLFRIESTPYSRVEVKVKRRGRETTLQQYDSGPAEEGDAPEGVPYRWDCTRAGDTTVIASATDLTGKVATTSARFRVPSCTAVVLRARRLARDAAREDARRAAELRNFKRRCHRAGGHVTRRDGVSRCVANAQVIIIIVA